jgi:feruloyl esterase
MANGTRRSWVSGVMVFSAPLGAAGIGPLAAACSSAAEPRPAAEPDDDVAAAVCTVAAARAAAPAGVTIGPIDDLNPKLPPVPAGALLVPAAGSIPPFCLVTGTVVTNPETGKTANFGVALPLTWNSKLLFSGCGGYCGVVFQVPPNDQRGGGSPPDALAKGYAIVATDDGHGGGKPLNGSWALRSPGVPDDDALTDYYHRAVHVVAAAGKQLAARWYSGIVERSYFFGCSNGGREGMVEATRYPDDFDGYIVGDPSFDLPGQILAGRAPRALLDAPGSYIPPALLTLVEEAVYASCDTADGMNDRLIQNPGDCAFDPKSLLCKGDDTSACLSPDHVRTLNAWFSAARDEQGRVVSFGFPVSDLAPDGEGNLFVWTEAAGPPRDMLSADPWGKEPSKQPAGWLFYDQSFKYLVHRDPDFDNNNESAVGSDGVVAEAALALLEERTEAGRGDDPRKLGPFIASGRKMIMYHGYSDGFISPFRTIRFYQDWAEVARGREALGASARLFMVPGMVHCNRGPGPNFFDALGALEQWVEQGRPPERLVATKYTNDDRTKPERRAMPLCPFPTQARYTGIGGMYRAESWSCVENQGLLKVGPAGERAGLKAPLRRP